jgi:hypothetical protein
MANKYLFPKTIFHDAWVVTWVPQHREYQSVMDGGTTSDGTTGDSTTAPTLAERHSSQYHARHYYNWHHKNIDQP